MSKRTETSQMTVVCRTKRCGNRDVLGEFTVIFHSETHLPTDQCEVIWVDLFNLVTYSPVLSHLLQRSPRSLEGQLLPSAGMGVPVALELPPISGQLVQSGIQCILPAHLEASL